MPMWFRAPDGSLRLVNSAYVRAVGGASAAAVVAAGTELIEPHRRAQRRASRAWPPPRRRSRPNAASPRPSAASAAPCGSATCRSARKALPATPSISRTWRNSRRDIPRLPRGAALDARPAFCRASPSSTPSASSFSPTCRSSGSSRSSPAMMHDPPSFDRLLDVARDAGRAARSARLSRLAARKGGLVFRRRRARGGLAAGRWHAPADRRPADARWRPAADRRGPHRAAPALGQPRHLAAHAHGDVRQPVTNWSPSSRPMAACSCGTGVSPGLGARRRLSRHPSAYRGAARKARRRKLARPQLAKAVGDVVRAATLDRKQTGGRAALADGRTLRLHRRAAARRQRPARGARHHRLAEGRRRAQANAMRR